MDYIACTAYVNGTETMTFSIHVFCFVTPGVVAAVVVVLVTVVMITVCCIYHCYKKGNGEL